MWSRLIRDFAKFLQHFLKFFQFRFGREKSNRVCIDVNFNSQFVTIIPGCSLGRRGVRPDFVKFLNHLRGNPSRQLLQLDRVPFSITVVRPQSQQQADARDKNQ